VFFIYKELGKAERRKGRGEEKKRTSQSVRWSGDVRKLGDNLGGGQMKEFHSCSGIAENFS